MFNRESIRKARLMIANWAVIVTTAKQAQSTVETADNGKPKQKKRTVSKHRINSKGERCQA